ncbi:succinate dehydrogenase cytochrome b subunit [Planctomicrobium piriforme]|uniref:Succinate dehydrogenase / fumarate reductase cytochrome b subunit n=1 Tax=Planctomicrobium piriforme TaxID=1576369 RepID=A0A1I3D089_9PLAN|nr:succinate dehydrogenase cytochrome b subunit [Planctomicrobium piriforme]SFH79949.1 succinate dehydrogenase / fumarate reductase cytochrome b subunit [Planctomicrobium piriforme]
MNWLKAFLVASVGKKYLMGVTGLFLCFFVVVHLAGNLLLYVGSDIYDEYAHKLHANPEFLIAAEVLLYAAFAFHIGFALWLQFQNRAARDKRYAYVQSKRQDRVLHGAMPTPDKTMFLTGLVVLLFLAVHLSDFKFELGWSSLEGAAPAVKAKVILSHVVRGAIYLVGAVILGVHVTHGFQSSFQSLGWNHPKYTPAIRCLSVILGLVVAIGFGSFPIVAWISNWGSMPAPPGG